MHEHDYMTYNSSQSPFSQPQSGAYSHGVFSSTSTTGWSSFSVSGTTSFSAIHTEVQGQVVTPYFNQPAAQDVYTRRNSREEEKPDSEATGQLGSDSPVGDMLLPLLTMAVVYVFVKLFRNHKTSTTL